MCQLRAAAHGLPLGSSRTRRGLLASAQKRRAIGPRRPNAKASATGRQALQSGEPAVLASKTSPTTNLATSVQTTNEVGTLTSHEEKAHQPYLRDDAFDIFGDIPFDFDDYSGFGIADLDPIGDSLDFIPLPTIDPTTIELEQRASPAADVSDTAVTESSRLNANTLFVDGVPADHNGTFDGGPDFTLKDDNRRLIQHYLVVMKGYAKVEDRPKDSNNLYVSAFSMSLFFPPLYYAILSFSAAHLAMEDSSYLEATNAYENLAEDAYRLQRRKIPLAVDGLLSALLVRAKRIHVTAGNIEVFLKLMLEAAELVSEPEATEALVDQAGLTRRVVIRLAILDSRASHYRLGGGALIERLRCIHSMSSIFYKGSGEKSTLAPALDVSSLLRADLFRMHVAALEERLQRQMQDELVTIPPVRTEEIHALYRDIKQAITEWDNQLDANVYDDNDNALSPSHYGYLTISAALHSSLLYLHLIYPLPQHPPDHSITAILQGQLRMRQDPTRSSSPSALSPSALFLAGAATYDPIRRDWVLDRFRAAERWGVYVRKARELLMEIAARQGQNQSMSTGDRGMIGLDVRTIMLETTGLFVI